MNLKNYFLKIAFIKQFMAFCCCSVAQLIMLSYVQSAYAERINGIKIDEKYGVAKQHYRYYFVKDKRDLFDKYGKKLPDTKIELTNRQKKRFQEAIAEWKRIKNSSICVTQHTSKKDIDTYESISKVKMNKLPMGILGVTKRFHNYKHYNADGEAKVYLSADISFNSDVLWDASKKASKISFFKVDFLSVALHEIGHALGLGHHKDNRLCNRMKKKNNVVMCPSAGIGSGSRHLKNRDKAAIRHIYPYNIYKEEDNCELFG